MGLKIIIKWNFKNDRTFNKSVEEGLAKPINTDDLPENSKEWLFLRRGIFLSRSQVDIIDCHLDSILQYSYYGNQDNKKIILKFIDFILTNPKMKDFVKDQLKDYETMTYQAKMKLIKDILAEMFDEGKKEEEEEQDQNYKMKTFLDNIATKTQLVFSLLNYHLKQ